MQVIGELPLGEAVPKLRAMGEREVADSMARSAQATTAAAPNTGSTTRLRGRRAAGGHPAWIHTGNVLGYLTLADSGPDLQPISSPAQIVPDIALKGAQINVTLDDLHVAEYPGQGTHPIWVHFTARRQPGHGPEQLHFITVCRVGEGEQNTVLARPIFVGLPVGAEGLHLQCITVNVLNEDDETLLKVFESNALQGGLQLQPIAQPSLALFSTLVLGLTKTIATHNRNVAVQSVTFGLDFSQVAPRPQLAEGSYIAAQIPSHAQAGWRWQDWGFDPAKRLIVSAQQPTQSIPYNYIAVRVSR
jgi:hypothetical protein